MSSPVPKKLTYPVETEGSRIAAETRLRANKLTFQKRQEHFHQAMAIVFGEDPAANTTGPEQWQNAALLL